MSDANHSMGPFVTHMIHDVKNPLTGVQGYLQLLKQIAGSSPDPRMDKYISKALQGCLDMNEFLTNLSDIVKFSDGRMKPELSLVDVSALIDTTVSMLNQRMNETRLIFIPQGPRSTARSDLRLLERAIHNLLLYSADTVPPKSEITLTLENGAGPAPHGLRISIEDRGEPFSEAVLRIIRESRGEIRFDEQTMAQDPGFSIQYASIVLSRMDGRLEAANLSPGKRFLLTLKSADPA